MDAEKRIIAVFEMIANNGIEAVLDFRHNNPQSFALEDAQKVLEPRLTQLSAQVQNLCRKHNLDDDLFNTLADAEACSGFVIGIIAGLDLAKRPDIVAKFAKMYAETTPEHLDRLFDQDGAIVIQRAN
jgi:hypothetical protein